MDDTLEPSSSSSSSNTIVKKRRSGLRSKSGCLTCRAKKVKCDEAIPSCRRCDRLELVCQQPNLRIIPSLRDRRPGAGPWRTRDQELWPQKPLSPSPSSPQLVGGLEPEDQRQPEESDTLLLTHYMSGYDHSVAVASGYGAQNASSNEPFILQNPMDVSFRMQPYNQRPSMNTVQTLEPDSIAGPNSTWILPHPQEFNSLLRRDVEPEIFEQFSLPTVCLTQHKIPKSAMELTEDEERAVTHFRTAFSLSQTTRDSEWSVPALLLNYALERSVMLLHLILAIALYDLSSSRSTANPMYVAAHEHYELGTQDLMKTLQNEACSDHLGVLGSFYCVYVYMAGQKVLSVSKLERLSLTSINHIIKHRLDVIPVDSSSTSSFSQPEVNRSERSLSARLIMWLLKLDAQCSFLGCKASVIKYFRAQPAKLNGIQAESRLALQLNWGVEYPISQSIRDIESCLPVDMMTDLLVICHGISELSKNFAEDENRAVLENLSGQLDALQAKYSAVLFYGSSALTLQPAMKLNCAISATMLYALRIYLLRCGSNPFGADECPAASHALAQLLLFARHTCPAEAHQPVYEFQWSLFIAAIETNDMIHQEWLQSRISEVRFSTALQRISTLKTAGGGIKLCTVRQILQGTL